MTDEDDTHFDIDDVDAVFERLLEGEGLTSEAPGWCSDVALLVRAAQAPPLPDELAGEADIVRRMSAVRLAARAGGASVAATIDDPPVPTTTGLATLASVSHLRDRRPRPDSLRGYRAKHAAERLETSRHPAVRTLGRVVAMKAAAVTTAAVIGVAAAAAATTGIVATVVVPALTGDGPREPDPAPETTDRSTRSGGTEQDSPRSDADEAGVPRPPTCLVLPACATPAPPAPPEAVAPTTPSTTTASTVTDELSTTSETTTTTEAPPATVTATTTTTVAPTTSTTVAADPTDPPVPQSASDRARPGGGRGSTAAKR
jgi:hypothetical protein